MSRCPGDSGVNFLASKWSPSKSKAGQALKTASCSATRKSLRGLHYRRPEYSIPTEPIENKASYHRSGHTLESLRRGSAARTRNRYCSSRNVAGGVARHSWRRLTRRRDGSINESSFLLVGTATA